MAAQTPTADASVVAQEKSLRFSLSKPGKGFILTQVALRVVAVVLTLASISVIVTSSQTILLFGYQFEARYNYSSAFRFLLGAEVVVCAFSAMSSVLSFLLSRYELPGQKYFFLFVHDMMMTVLIMSGCAAATAIGYVGRFGEERMAWQPVCDQVAKFCNKVLVAVVFSYLASFTYLALTTMTARRLMAGA